jgi:hypothetical protein
MRLRSFPIEGKVQEEARYAPRTEPRYPFSSSSRATPSSSPSRSTAMTANATPLSSASKAHPTVSTRSSSRSQPQRKRRSEERGVNNSVATSRLARTFYFSESRAALPAVRPRADAFVRGQAVCSSASSRARASADVPCSAFSSPFGLFVSGRRPVSRPRAGRNEHTL